jgi:16S rRNA G966 N2-methylase RsmD
MPVNMRVINLEESRPTVDEMNRRLALELTNAKNARAQVLKLIHGYGSTGVGGKLRGAVRVTLEHAKKRGEIREFVQGDQFRISNEVTWAMLKVYPELKHDRDFGRENRGITIVLL